MVLITRFVLVLIMWFVLVLMTWFVVVLFTWIVLILITWFVLLLITWFVLVLKLGELENLEAVFLRGLLPPPEVHIWREPEIVTLTFGNRNCLSSSFRSTFVKHFESGENFYLHKQRQYIWIRLLTTATLLSSLLGRYPWFDFQPYKKRKGGLISYFLGHSLKLCKSTFSNSKA